MLALFVFEFYSSYIICCWQAFHKNMSLSWSCHNVTSTGGFSKIAQDDHSTERALIGQKVRNIPQQPKLAWIFINTVRRYSHALQALYDHRATPDPRLTNFNRRFLAELMAHIARSAPNTERLRKIMFISLNFDVSAKGNTSGSLLTKLYGFNQRQMVQPRIYKRMIGRIAHQLSNCCQDSIEGKKS